MSKLRRHLISNILDGSVVAWTTNNLTSNTSSTEFEVWQDSTDNDSTPAWKAMDGNSSTYQQNDWTDYKNYWCIDFKKPVELYAFEINVNNEASTGMYLEYSDDKTTWSKLIAETLSGSGTYTYNITPTAAHRYYRFNNERNNYYLRINEVRFQYGSNKPNISIDSNQIIDSTINTSIIYNISYSTNTNKTPKFSIIDGSLPEGLSLNSVTGTIYGITSNSYNGSLTLSAEVSGLPPVIFNINIIIRKPLRLTAAENNSTVKLVSTGTPTVTGLQYKLNNSSKWMQYKIDTVLTLENINDYVEFKNTEDTLSTGTSSYVNFVMTGKIRASESVQSLLNFNSACNAYCYVCLFKNCSSLITAPELPATTIVSHCYYSMFQGCTGLTSAPSLPGRTMQVNCYNSMFRDCTGLTTMPDLPATTLSSQSYGFMFKNCTNLTNVTRLPATKLGENCYYAMFDGCTKLTKGPALPATTLTRYCYATMFKNCTSLTEAPVLSATNLAPVCYEYMFHGCTNLTVAPELPATTLADSCYAGMFYACSNLKYIKVNFTDWDNAVNIARTWVLGVPSTGTFVAPASLIPEFGSSRIPTGWSCPNHENRVIANDQSFEFAPNTDITYKLKYGMIPTTLKPTIAITNGNLPNGLVFNASTGEITGNCSKNSVSVIEFTLSYSGYTSAVITLTLNCTLKKWTENNLTSNDSNPDFVVSQRTTSGTNYAWKAMDNNTSTYSNTSATNGQTDWWMIDFKRPVKLLEISVNSSSSIYLEAKNEDEFWTRIDSSQFNSGTTARSYNLNNLYQYYRLIRTTNYSYLRLNEVKFYYEQFGPMIIAKDVDVTWKINNEINYTIPCSVFDSEEALIFEIISGTLPTGLTLNTQTGVISGTPTQLETKNLSIKISNNDAADVTINLNIKIAANNLLIENGLTYYNSFSNIRNPEVGNTLTITTTDNMPVSNVLRGVTCVDLNGTHTYLYDANANYWNTGGSGVNDVTCSVWLYLHETGLPVNTVFLSLGKDISLTSGKNIIFQTDAEANNSIACVYVGHYGIPLFDDEPYQANTWYHLVFVTHNGNAMDAYINGKFKQGQTRGTTYKQLKHPYFSIGGAGTSASNATTATKNNTNPFALAGLRIFNRVLSADEIKLLYNEFQYK